MIREREKAMALMTSLAGTFLLLSSLSPIHAQLYHYTRILYKIIEMKRRPSQRDIRSQSQPADSSSSPLPSSSSPSQWDQWNSLATSMTHSWIDVQGMEVFRKALSDEDLNSNGEPPIEKISSVSDFAPIKERVTRRKGKGKGTGTNGKVSKRRKDVTREGFAYHVSRWPLLVSNYDELYIRHQLM